MYALTKGCECVAKMSSFSLEDLVHDDHRQVVVDDDVAHHLLLAD